QDPRSAPQRDLRGSVAEQPNLRARYAEHNLGLRDELSMPSGRQLVTAGRSYADWAPSTKLTTSYTWGRQRAGTRVCGNSVRRNDDLYARTLTQRRATCSASH